MILSEMFAAQTSGGGGGGIDPVIFMFVVGGLCTAITTLATVLWRQKEREAEDLRKDNREIRERLAKYEDLAPDLLSAVESMRSRQIHEPTSSDGGARSRRETRLPYPYRSPRPSSRGARKPK